MIMRKDTSFILVSIVWMILFNMLVLHYFISKGFIDSNLIVGAVVAPTDASFLPTSALKVAAPLLILNFIILAALIFAYEKWVKEKKNIESLA